MTSGTKWRVISWLGLVMLLTGLMAASLPQLELHPGMPIPRVENSPAGSRPIEVTSSGPLVIDKFAILLFALVSVALVLVLILITNIGAVRNQARFILLIVFLFLILGGILYLVLELLPANLIQGFADELPLPKPKPFVTSPLGQVPPLLLWIVGIGLLAFLGGLGIWMFGSSRRPTTIDLVGLEAQIAWQGLQNGLALRDVILQCYRQMSLVLEKSQGIKRKESMTTREFEIFLESAGIPHDPLHQLTQLFEAVRYGNWQPNPVDQQKAIRSLESIMAYSRAAKKAD
jgi:hypothetical protein